MWNREKSLVLSKISVVLFTLVLVAILCVCPWALEWLFAFSANAREKYTIYFYITVYSGGVLALAIFYNLWRLLSNIGRGDVFVEDNVTRMRRISWVCIAAGAVAAASAFYYLPWAVVAAACAFMGIILRVLKNVLAEANLMKKEISYTI